MHLAAFVQGPGHVCCRYRLAAYRPFFEQAGHTLELRSWPNRWWSRLMLGQNLDSIDVLILQRRLPRWQLSQLRRKVPALVFDFDDAVFMRDSYSPKGPHSPDRLRHFAAVASAADAVVAGNSYLAEQARAAGARHTVIVPTCVDQQRYPQAEHRRTGREVQLVWIGSSSTLRGLETIRPMLEEVGRQCQGVSLKIICDRFLQFRHLPVVCCPWSDVWEATELATSDIGISWLPDDSWSRGKCGLKVLQYMAAGLPVIANPVGVQAEMVRHGESGFLVETVEEWVAAVQTLATDPELRRRMGQAGRERVGLEFDVSRGAVRWLEVLSSLPTIASVSA